MEAVVLHTLECPLNCVTEEFQNIMRERERERVLRMDPDTLYYM